MRMDKPTKTEGEYFAREDAEKMKRLKERIRQEILEAKHKIYLLHEMSEMRRGIK